MIATIYMTFLVNGSFALINISDGENLLWVLKRFLMISVRRKEEILRWNGFRSVNNFFFWWHGEAAQRSENVLRIADLNRHCLSSDILFELYLQ